MYEVPAFLYDALRFQDPRVDRLRLVKDSEWKAVLSSWRVVRLTLPLRQVCDEDAPASTRILRTTPFALSASSKSTLQPPPHSERRMPSTRFLKDSPSGPAMWSTHGFGHSRTLTFIALRNRSDAPAMRSSRWLTNSPICFSMLDTITCPPWLPRHLGNGVGNSLILRSPFLSNFTFVGGTAHCFAFFRRA